MIELFKQRTFGDFFNDTISFFKTSGKSFFKFFFLINGIPIILLTVISYVLIKVVFEALFSGTSNIDSYFLDNLNFLVPLALLLIFLFFIINAFNFTYPVAYLQFLEKNETPNMQGVLSFYKQNLKKIAVFFLVLIVFSIVFLTLYLLLFIIPFIGILLFLLILLVIPVLYCGMMQVFFEYLSQNISFGKALSKGWQNFMSNALINYLTTVLIYFITQTFATIITMIGYFVLALIFFVGMYDGIDSPDANLFSIGITLIFSLSVIATIFFNSLSIVHQGLIYYSCQEKAKKHQITSAIDLIGQDDEA